MWYFGVAKFNFPLDYPFCIAISLGLDIHSPNSLINIVIIGHHISQQSLREEQQYLLRQKKNENKMNVVSTKHRDDESKLEDDSKIGNDRLMEVRPK